MPDETTRVTRIADLALRLLFPTLVALYGVGFARSISGRSAVVAGYPRVILVALAVVVLLAAVVDLVQSARGREVVITSLDPRVQLSPQWWRGAVIAGLLVLTLWSASRLGFFASAALFVLVSMMVMGIRRPLPLAAMTVGFTLTAYYVFAVFFRLRLPEGLLP
jgi:hypothetical protein